MTRLILPTLFLGLAACTPSDMISMSKQHCTQIGYTSGTSDHTACVERGFTSTKRAQDGAIAQSAANAITSAVIRSMY